MDIGDKIYAGTNKHGPPSSTMCGRRWLLLAILAVAFVLWHPVLAFQPLQLGRAAGTSRRCHAFLAPGSTGTGFGGDLRRALSTRGGRRRPDGSPAHPDMPAPGPTPTNGLTTGSGVVDRGGGGLPHLDSDLFVFPPPPSLAINNTDFAASSVSGSPHFGDIMGGTEGKGADLLHHFEPLERVILTANGNLQRVVSSYYDSPVTVDINRCNEIEDSVYDREVTLSVLGRTFCIAKSLVVLHSPACVEAVKRGDVGIGQLFRSLDVLPSFELLNAGRTCGDSVAADEEERVNGEGGGRGDGGRRSGKGRGLWRVYDLRSRHVSCRIHEEFPPDLFDLTAR